MSANSYTATAAYISPVMSQGLLKSCFREWTVNKNGKNENCSAVTVNKR